MKPGASLSLPSRRLGGRDQPNPAKRLRNEPRKAHEGRVRTRPVGRASRASGPPDQKGTAHLGSNRWPRSEAAHRSLRAAGATRVHEALGRFLDGGRPGEECRDMIPEPNHRAVAIVVMRPLVMRVLGRSLTL